MKLTTITLLCVSVHFIALLEYENKSMIDQFKQYKKMKISENPETKIFDGWFHLDKIAIKKHIKIYSDEYINWEKDLFDKLHQLKKVKNAADYIKIIELSETNHIRGYLTDDEKANFLELLQDTGYQSLQ